MGLLSAASKILGGWLSGDSEREAADRLAQSQLQIKQQQAEASKFKPVGTSSIAGTTNYQYDPSGRLTSANYTLSPEFKALQNQLMGAAPGMLGQFTGSMDATRPMGTAAQTMFGLGQGYLATDPRAQAAKYMAQQQELLAPSRAESYTNMLTNLQNTGRMGLSVGGGVAGMQATNPEMAAYYNALLQQDRELASKADLGGQQYAQFGAGMVGSGGTMLRDMYATQVAAKNPYDAAMAGVNDLEAAGLANLTRGMGYGTTVTNSAANAAGLLASGQDAVAQAQYKNDSYSPWGALFSGVGDALGGVEDTLLGAFTGKPLFGQTAGVSPTPNTAGAPQFTAPRAYTVGSYTTDGGMGLRPGGGVGLNTNNLSWWR